MIFECPKCGGQNRLEFAENEFIRCTYCNSYSYIDLDGIISVYTYKSLINIEDTTLFLKKDFDKTGFSEKFKVISSYPVYVPFWDFDADKALLAGSSQIEDDSTLRPSEEKVIFDFDEIKGSIEILEPDRIPEKDEKKTLCYLPFYKVIISYREEKYDFFVNGMNGEISGDPIPFVSVQEAGSLFPQFLLIFVVAVIVNFVFNNLLLSIFANIVAVYLLFSFSISKINRKLYKNEH